MAGYNYAQNIIGLKKGNGDIHELEVEVANLSASVLSIAGDVSKLKTKLNIFGYLPCFVTTGKNIILSFPIQGKVDYNHLELSKSSGIAVDIYGDKSATATTFSAIKSTVENKTVYIIGEIPENIETFATLNRLQCILIKEGITATLSNVT